MTILEVGSPQLMQELNHATQSQLSSLLPRDYPGCIGLLFNDRKVVRDLPESWPRSRQKVGTELPGCSFLVRKAKAFLRNSWKTLASHWLELCSMGHSSSRSKPEKEVLSWVL